jgi:succinate dehydrogenase / fumarate reductase, cytochrome b subunit
MTQRRRPLSPHLSVYRAQLTSVVSVMQRVTGAGLALGLAYFVLWIGAAAYGPDVYEWAIRFLTSWFGYLSLVGISVCFFFHLCNGIRHLVWDLGWGFDLPEVFAGAYLVLGGTVVFTVATWVVVALRFGGV